jgi:hypothetical protein
VDLRDATLMIWNESGDHPAVAQAARAVYDALAEGREVGGQALTDLIGVASDKGVLRQIYRRHSPVAAAAIVEEVLREAGRRTPVPPRPRPAEPDPLTASAWPPA